MHDTELLSVSSCIGLAVAVLGSYHHQAIRLETVWIPSLMTPLDIIADVVYQPPAGLLPAHPLMEPRRLTDGALSNTSNAWGSAAAEAAGSGPGWALPHYSQAAEAAVPVWV